MGPAAGATDCGAPQFGQNAAWDATAVPHFEQCGIFVSLPTGNSRKAIRHLRGQQDKLERTAQLSRMHQPNATFTRRYSVPQERAACPPNL